MGNSQSAQSDHTNSIRSRTSRKARASLDKLPVTRASQAVSFYQTPPGSFDAGLTPAFTPRTTNTSPTSSESPFFNQATTQIEAAPVVPTVQRKWKPGVYSLVNAKGGTALDLSGGDNKSIIGFPVHDGTNQQVSLAKNVVATINVSKAHEFL